MKRHPKDNLMKLLKTKHNAAEGRDFKVTEKKVNLKNTAPEPIYTARKPALSTKTDSGIYLMQMSPVQKQRILWSYIRMVENKRKL